MQSLSTTQINVENYVQCTLFYILQRNCISSVVLQKQLYSSMPFQTHPELIQFVSSRLYAIFVHLLTTNLRKST